MTMLERVARAICKSRTCEGVNCCQWPGNGGQMGDFGRTGRKCPVANGAYDEAARAAIEAMRQPTNPMIRASMLALHEGKKSLGWSKKERSIYLPAPTKVVMRWNAMVDAALKEQP